MMGYSCKTCQRTVETQQPIPSKSAAIDYCHILDSMKALPQYDYSLVKHKTVFIDATVFDNSDSLKVKDAQEKGLRVVFTNTQTTPYRNMQELYFMDSLKYTGACDRDASSLIMKMISDSLRNEGIIDTDRKILGKIIGDKFMRAECVPEYRKGSNNSHSKQE